MSALARPRQARPTIALLATVGWALRDWVISDFLPAVTKDADIIVFSPEADLLRQTYHFDHVSFEAIAAKPLSRWRMELLWILTMGHRYRRHSFIDRQHIERDYEDWPWLSRMKQHFARLVARGIVRPLSLPTIRRIEQHGLGLAAESARLEEIFRDRGVSLVFSTLPLVTHYERPALWAAQRLNLPTACMVTSWDNLQSKGQFPVDFSHYLLWSSRMLDELRRFCPGVADTDVTITGPPQFDFYRKASLLQTRTDFLRSIGGDPNRPLILWSGASTNQLPGEPQILAAFCEAVRQGRIAGNPQVLLRPHPVGGGARFESVAKQYPELLFTETNRTEPVYLTGWTPMLDDIALLVNSVAHCDVNVNHCSTMTLDCCALDRPVVNLAFDSVAGSRSERELQACYSYEHYRPVVDAGAVRLAWNLDQLVDHVNEYLSDHALDRDGRQQALSLHCGAIDGRATLRAAEALLALVGIASTSNTPAGAPVETACVSQS